MCLCEGGEELHLLTLPLSSFVKSALQKWSYKAKISVSEKQWHCTCLLKFALNSHRLNVGMDLISQSNFHRSCIKTMGIELKSVQANSAATEACLGCLPPLLFIVLEMIDPRVQMDS